MTVMNNKKTWKYVIEEYYEPEITDWGIIELDANATEEEVWAAVEDEAETYNYWCARIVSVKEI